MVGPLGQCAAFVRRQVGRGRYSHGIHPFLLSLTAQHPFQRGEALCTAHHHQGVVDLDAGVRRGVEDQGVVGFFDGQNDQV
ncbi:hypothetical protein DESC_290143 [Desulfosarcina cetonica]|nr:hypothetical protein DESC_290143 [Desulfosarcina cetonica]